MGTHLEKIKAIFFLILMSLTCVGIVFVVNQLKKEPVYTEVNAQEEVIIDNSTASQTNSDTTQPQKVEESDEGIVLASTQGGECKDTIVKIQSYSVCERSGSADIDGTTGVRSGDQIRKDATIVLEYVSMPLELFAGSEVKDSNRKITSTTPVYKAAGEQIDEKTANIMLPPGTQINEYKPWVANRPFSNWYSTLFSGKEAGEEGEIVVDKTIKNDCEECNNPSNVNPDKSNKISEFMNDSVYRTPGKKDEVQPSDAIESCDEKDTFVEWPDSSRKMCPMGVINRTITLIKTGITDGIWNRCQGTATDENGNLIPKSNECMFVEDIIIKMSSSFGSDTECPDGICTNTYMNNRNKSALSPVSSSSYSDKVYYLTECGVLVSGKSYSVKCAWDVSHLFKERKLSEYDDLPDIEKTPTKSEYQNFLTEEAIRRSDEPEVEIF